MKKTYPQRLKAGDEIRVIAPSRSMSIISKEVRETAKKRFAELGLKLSFGAHVEESDAFASSSVESRVADFHDAFRDKGVKGILTVIGGFNSNQLLDRIDWKLVRDNPKALCGYSDITILSNAIFAKTGLVTYYGPHFSSFGEKLHFEYSLEAFKKALMSEGPAKVVPSERWSNDAWYKDQDDRKLVANEGWWVINKGKAKGTIIGGNLCTLNLLQGTRYFPAFSEDTVLFLEDDAMAGAQSDVEFDRNLQSLIQQPGFGKVKGIVVGRFEVSSAMTREKLSAIIKSKKELDGLPVIANADFGHTTPMITFPIGGTAEIDADRKEMSIL